MAVVRYRDEDVFGSCPVCGSYEGTGSKYQPTYERPQRCLTCAWWPDVAVDPIEIIPRPSTPAG